MNKDRRNRLQTIIDKLEDVRTGLEDLKNDIEDVKYDEEEAKDNLSESLQESDRYYNMEENVDDLESAMDVDFDSVIDELEEYLQNCIDR